MCCNRHTLFGVTDGVSGRKNGLVKDIFHALHDEISPENPSVTFDLDRYYLRRTGMAERTLRYDDIRPICQRNSKKIDICTGKTQMEFTGYIFLNHSYPLASGPRSMISLGKNMF